MFLGFTQYCHVNAAFTTGGEGIEIQVRDISYDPVSNNCCVQGAFGIVAQRLARRVRVQTLHAVLHQASAVGLRAQSRPYTPCSTRQAP